MKLLLDTVTFLDAAISPNGISKYVRDLLLDSENDLFVSVASSWEIAIKYSIGKLSLPDRPESFVKANRQQLGAEMLELDEESVFHILRLPAIHADPFDRILISQAIVHGMILVTPDDRISRYPVRSAW
jgi:PIN domain nuclease of toxin-antitoxin system